MNYLYLPIEHMPFGKERRAFIMKAFENTEDAAYAVNCKHRPQLKSDPDLNKLIKSSKLRRLRVGGGNSLCGAVNGHTILVLNY